MSTHESRGTPIAAAGAGPGVHADQLQRVAAAVGHVLAGPRVGAHRQDPDDVRADRSTPLAWWTLTSATSVDFTAESGTTERDGQHEPQAERQQPQARQVAVVPAAVIGRLPSRRSPCFVVGRWACRAASLSWAARSPSRALARRSEPRPSAVDGRQLPGPRPRVASSAAPGVAAGRVIGASTSRNTQRRVAGRRRSSRRSPGWSSARGRGGPAPPAPTVKPGNASGKLRARVVAARRTPRRTSRPRPRRPGAARARGRPSAAGPRR